ncbi:MAG: hypothetical protein C5B51_11200 [Terriglobia bacterium]|nr:MAG: hypothetical protein C5B51_11200 [Terriglobia bacterium]
MANARRKALIFPREHGAWGILLIPLVSGGAVGVLAGGQLLPLAPLTAAALALFWLRTPVESWSGTGPMRACTPAEKRLVRTTALALIAAGSRALLWLFWGSRGANLLWIGAAAAASFLGQAALKKLSRRFRTAAQMVGAIGLTATAPAAYAAATGHLNEVSWSLWAANLLFALNQIHFVHLLIHIARPATCREKLRQGKAFLAAQTVLLVAVALAAGLHMFRWYAAAAFLPALIRGFAWFARPSAALAVRSLGWSELGLSTGFGALLITGLLH